MHVEILLKLLHVLIHLHVMHFLGMLSPTHTLLLCLSLTDVYVLISNCSLTCVLQTFPYISTMINIHKTQSHIHSHQLMYL